MIFDLVEIGWKRKEANNVGRDHSPINLHPLFRGTASVLHVPVSDLSSCIHYYPRLAPLATSNASGHDSTATDPNELCIHVDLLCCHCFIAPRDSSSCLPVPRCALCVPRFHYSSIRPALLIAESDRTAYLYGAAQRAERSRSLPVSRLLDCGL